MQSGELNLLGNEMLGATLLNPIKRKARPTYGLDKSECLMVEDVRKSLEAHFRKACPTEYNNGFLRIPGKMKIFKRVRMFEQVFGSVGWNGGKNAYILSRFVRSTTSVKVPHVATMWPGYVRYYIRVDMLRVSNPGDEHSVKTLVPFYFAYCSWFRPRSHSKELADSIWQRVEYKEHDDSIIPLYRISSLFIPAPLRNGDFQILINPHILTLCEPDEYAPGYEELGLVF